MQSHLSAKNYDDIKLFNLITSDLSELGFSSSTKGYTYISHAIFFAVQDKQHLCSIHGTLFPKIAQLFKSSTKNVTKACRAAVDNAYFSGGFKNINEVLGFSYLLPYEKPKLNNFISTLTERSTLWFNKIKDEGLDKTKKSFILKLNKPFSRFQLLHCELDEGQDYTLSEAYLSL